MKHIDYIKKHTICLFLILLVFSACKKNKSKPEPGDEENTEQTSITNRTDLTNDSLFLYAKQIYYWNGSLPSYDVFKPRQYNTASTDFANFSNNLFNIVRSSGSADYIQGSADPKYSYIEDITKRNPEALASVPNAKASVDLEGNGNDVGIMVIAYLNSQAMENGSYLLFVTAVYPGSPADKKGIKRGWLIQKINGRPVGVNYNSEFDFLNSVLSGSTVTLEGIKFAGGVQGDKFNVMLNRTSYKSNPVYLSKVLRAGEKKIGYLVYARFSNETNSNAVLDAAFDDFALKGVTDLIIDLRYNGGGYVNTAEHLVNLIAPSTATGLMYKEYYNATLQNKKADILKNQPLLDDNEKVQYQDGRMLNYFDDIDYSIEGNTHSFNKAGSLNVTNVIFIVSRNTASASELVINSLKPKMNVKLVGETTYGKPVGFFSIRLQNRYDVYFSLFETKNSLDQGGYFSGMTPDYAENNNENTFYDNPQYDFGDEGEGYLAKAISVLNPSKARSVTALARKSVTNIRGKQVSGNKEFTGMIETRHNIKE